MGDLQTQSRTVRAPGLSYDWRSDYHGDFAYLGLIGSTTKRTRFERRLRAEGITEGRLARLTCPIGLPGLRSKEPAVIAVSLAAQLIQVTQAP